jgi:hypothetical protein
MNEWTDSSPEWTLPIAPKSETGTDPHEKAACDGFEP